MQAFYFCLKKCKIFNCEVDIMNPEIYLLGQVFDSIQFNYQHNFGNDKVVDTFDRKYTKGAIYNLRVLIELSKQYQVNPIWLMVSCFDTFKFVNQKRKSLPLMRIGNLNKEHIIKAYQTKLNYQRVMNYNSELSYYPYLNDFMRSVINYLNYDNPEKAKESAKVEIRSAVESYYLKRYEFDSDKELLRLHLIRNNKHKTWDSLLLLEGVAGFNSLLFLIASDPVRALLRHSKPSEVNYYYFGFKGAQKYAISPHELLYIKRSFEYLEKEGLTV